MVRHQEIQSEMLVQMLGMADANFELVQLVEVLGLVAMSVWAPFLALGWRLMARFVLAGWLRMMPIAVESLQSVETRNTDRSDCLQCLTRTQKDLNIGGGGGRGCKQVSKSVPLRWVGRRDANGWPRGM